MRKTASGRWVADRPEPLPLPSEPPTLSPRKGNASYDGYLFHRHAHEAPADNCVWCDPGGLAGPPPWGLLSSISLVGR